MSRQEKRIDWATRCLNGGTYNGFHVCLLDIDHAGECALPKAELRIRQLCFAIDSLVAELEVRKLHGEWREVSRLALEIEAQLALRRQLLSNWKGEA
jgi:hypothetical protein